MEWDGCGRIKDRRIGNVARRPGHWVNSVVARFAMTAALAVVTPGMPAPAVLSPHGLAATSAAGLRITAVAVPTVKTSTECSSAGQYRPTRSSVAGAHLFGNAAAHPGEKVGTTLIAGVICHTALDDVNGATGLVLPGGSITLRSAVATATAQLADGSIGPAVVTRFGPSRSACTAVYPVAFFFGPPPSGFDAASSGDEPRALGSGHGLGALTTFGIYVRGQCRSLVSTLRATLVVDASAVSA